MLVTVAVGSFSHLKGNDKIVLETVVGVAEVEIQEDVVGNGCVVADESCAAVIEIKLVLLRNFITGAEVEVVVVMGISTA